MGDGPARGPEGDLQEADLHQPDGVLRAVRREPPGHGDRRQRDLRKISYSSRIRMFLNSTRVPWPRNPMCPLRFISPGRGLRISGSVTSSRLASTIVVPLSTTVMRRPRTEISCVFHSPTGF